MRLFPNGAQSTVPSSLSSSATSITPTSAGSFGSLGTGQTIDALLVDSGNPGYSAGNPLATPYEYVIITAIVSGVFTVTRAQYGSSATSFYAGATISCSVQGAFLATLSGYYNIDVWQTTNTTLSTSASTTVTYNNVGNDPSSSWSTTNNQYTAQIAGRFLVTALVSFTSATNNNQIMVNVNGTAVSAGESTWGASSYNSAGDVSSSVVSTVVRVTVGQTIQLQAQAQTVGANSTVLGQAKTNLSISYLGG